METRLREPRHGARPRSGVEVDFVVYGEGAFYAFEVNNAGDVRNNDLRSLKSFREEYPECRTALLYRGADRLLVDDVPCVPVARFLSELEPWRAMRVAFEE